MKSIYIAGHERHVHPKVCQMECGPNDSDKLNMLNHKFGVNILPLPAEALVLVEQKRKITLAEMTKDLGKTLIESGKRVLSGQSPVVSEQEQKRRMDICLACDEYRPETKRCSLCGCYMNIKTWIAAGRCKLEKWNER